MRDVFYPERDRIRAMFEKNKSLRDPGAIERAIEDGEKTLDGYAHPDPYTVPSSYGGSKYARNPPPPGIEILYDFGRERGTTPGPDGHYR
jgi:NADH dehydrogenase (ubiquinone) 1 beta subcomplex subunit 9|tara:strand:- start:191 stop:460 length:270 start_codon:yes stop_codon:yes gene_type:complete